MKLSIDQLEHHKKTFLQILTFALWLLTVGLGFLALTNILETADAQILAFGFDKVENQEMGLSTVSGLRRIVNYAVVFLTVIAWIGAVVIGGMEYHFKRAGQRNSYRLFAWTIGIELVIIGVSLLLRSP
jgi:uncharacterized membrane protein YbhN (UPF0104 family)